MGESSKAAPTHRSTHSAIDGNDQTHDEVAENTGADGHSPAEADGDHGRSDFPIGDSPRVGHPVGDVGLPGPCALGWRDGVKVGVGGIFRRREAALFLVNCETEARQAAFEAGRLTNFDVGRGWGATWAHLVVNVFRIVGRHGSWCDYALPLRQRHRCNEKRKRGRKRGSSIINHDGMRPVFEADSTK